MTAERIRVDKMTKSDWIEYYMTVCGYDYIEAEKLAERKMEENESNRRL